MPRTIDRGPDHRATTEGYWTTRRSGTWAVAILIAIVIVGFGKHFWDKEAKAEAGRITAAPPVFQRCSGESDYRFETVNDFGLPVLAKSRVTVTLHPQCWSGWVVIPESTPKYQFNKPANDGVEIEFKDGYREWIPPDASPNYNFRGIFRFRGEGVVIVSLAGLDFPTPKNQVLARESLKR